MKKKALAKDPEEKLKVDGKIRKEIMKDKYETVEKDLNLVNR